MLLQHSGQHLYTKKRVLLQSSQTNLKTVNENRQKRPSNIPQIKLKEIINLLPGSETRLNFLDVRLTA